LNNSNLDKELDYLKLNPSLKGNFTKAIKIANFDQFLDIRIEQEPSIYNSIQLLKIISNYLSAISNKKLYKKNSI
jgi:hypothetical protein